MTMTAPRASPAGSARYAVRSCSGKLIIVPMPHSYSLAGDDGGDDRGDGGAGRRRREAEPARRGGPGPRAPRVPPGRFLRRVPRLGGGGAGVIPPPPRGPAPRPRAPPGGARPP